MNTKMTDKAKSPVTCDGLLCGALGFTHSSSCSVVLVAQARCEATPWPEQHRDDCAWCAHLTEGRGTP